MIQYNKGRYLELLKKREKKSISDTESLELLNYSAMLDGQLDWETRYQYLQLLEELMKEKISICEFLTAFRERYELNAEVLYTLESKLVLLELNEKSSDFGDFIQQLWECCSTYSPEPEPYRSKYELNETELRDCIEETYPQIKKFLEE